MSNDFSKKTYNNNELIHKMCILYSRIYRWIYPFYPVHEFETAIFAVRQRMVSSSGHKVGR